MRRRTYVDGEDMGWTCSWSRLAPVYQIGSRSTNRVLDNVGDQTGKRDAYDEAQYGDM